MNSVSLYQKDQQAESCIFEDFPEVHTITSSIKKISLDDTSKKLTIFEKKYDDMRREHEAEVSFFISRLQSIDTPSIFQEFFDTELSTHPRSDCNDFTKDENVCLSKCFMIGDSSRSIMRTFDNREEKDRKEHFSLQLLLETIKNDREAMQKDIRNLKAANVEQVYNLKKGTTHLNMISFPKTSSIQHHRSTWQHNPPSKTNKSGIHILQSEVAQLQEEKSQLNKSVHELVQKRVDYQAQIRQLKKQMREDVEEQRVVTQSLELRYLDAGRKSKHLEEANMKLDEICRTLAGTIETTKSQLDSFRYSLGKIHEEHVDNSV